MTKGKPNIEFPLDEEDFTSSEGGSEFPQGKIAKDINYIATADDTVQQHQPPPQQQQQQVRQTGRRNQRETAQQQQQQLQQQAPDSPQDESYLAQAPESLSPGFSPVYSGFGGAKARPPSGGIRVLPASSNLQSPKYFTDNTGSPVSSGSPTLTQAVGLPSPPLNNRSTQV